MDATKNIETCVRATKWCVQNESTQNALVELTSLETNLKTHVIDITKQHRLQISAQCQVIDKKKSKIRDLESEVKSLKKELYKLKDENRLLSKKNGDLETTLVSFTQDDFEETEVTASQEADEGKPLANEQEAEEAKPLANEQKEEAETNNKLNDSQDETVNDSQKEMF